MRLVFIPVIQQQIFVFVILNNDSWLKKKKSVTARGDSASQKQPLVDWSWIFFFSILFSNSNQQIHVKKCKFPTQRESLCGVHINVHLFYSLLKDMIILR